MACGCIPSWDHSLCARSAALYLSAAAEVKCALCEAGLCPHTPHGTWMVFGWTQVLDQAISLLERIFNCKPKEPSNYSSSLKCIWRLYGVGLLGVFCSLLTGMNVKVFKFLKLKVYGCVSCGTSNVPAAKDAETYSCHPFGTTEIYPCQHRRKLGFAGKYNTISVCKVFSLFEMYDSLGGS